MTDETSHWIREYRINAARMRANHTCRADKRYVMRKIKRFKGLRCLTEKLPPLSFFAYFADCLTAHQRPSRQAN